METKKVKTLEDIQILITAEFPEFQTLNKCKTVFLHDPDSVNLFNEINDLRQSKAILQAQNMGFEPEEEAKLERLMIQMRSNEKIMDYLRAKNSATSAAKQIANFLTDKFEVPFSSGGCCG